jgi:hypothetical protein
MSMYSLGAVIACSVLIVNTRDVFSTINGNA